MKPWMIATAVGVIGIALAALLVPWGQLTREPNPEILVPPPAGSTVTTPAQPRQAGDPQAASERFDRPSSTAPAMPVTAAPVEGVERPEPTINPARQAAAERNKQPDMQLIMASDMKWQAMLQNMGSRPRDPAADGAIERVRQLRDKMTEYQRNPSQYNINELMAEQEHILGEMKQTQYWDKDFQAFESDLETQWAAYRQETGTKHPYQ